ncbi:class I SAM-dependent methyltransferase [Bdellovibrionota bacterium FG-1]
MARVGLGVFVSGPEAQDRLPEDHFELEALAQAHHYQRWIYRTIEPFLGSRILEFGAGIGNMSQWLPVREKLILTETDPALLKVLMNQMGLRHGEKRGPLQIASLDLAQDDLTPYVNENLDTIISFNVLEHIQEDHQVFLRLSELLRKSRASGPRRLVSFVPAHAWAFGSLDRRFGHHRRYSAPDFRRMVTQVAPDARLTLRYFNLLGLAGWLFHGRLLRRRQIGLQSIAAFERLCPYVSRADDWIHRATRVPLGQSLLAVMEWR